MGKKSTIPIPDFSQYDEDETIGVHCEKDGILIVLDTDYKTGKLKGTVSKVLEYVEAEKYTDELFFGLLNKYYNNGENHHWTRVSQELLTPLNEKL